ncbi:methylated-DNA--[protein]-cysteine S-methyltransferase [Vibrio hippocampi]|uniref:Methylated-DNA--protein-cysteine methyltransferase n=1 Tax=Vibrio hippocampi TaxID=654686 RepID=A0ABN8DM66_9VIBR|nr:methylated-DNA--[protein]-cysteine S-methyltransferase [Vibrio hippocampi]CAH0528737.1 Methylated-DNA--protein-cysteine methyltransferase, constitutive [Vibrio hippocampi]
MKYYTTMESPLGTVTIQTTDIGLTGIWFENHTTMPSELGEHNQQHEVLRLAKQQLQAYFAGQLTQFDLPLAATGTAFQQQVWQALTEIEFGESLSYQQLANRIGNPKAVRAVGAANGKNPISIVVPCHRVIGANGSLTGYAGGIEVKKQLLKLENIDIK